MSARTIVGRIAAVACVIVGGLAVMEHKAGAAEPGCTVTRAEYAKIKRGMPLDRVVRIVGCKGRTSYAATLYGTRYVDRTWHPSTSRYGTVAVSFKGKRGQAVKVTSKWVVW